jgi:hypothetical protein
LQFESVSQLVSAPAAFHKSFLVVVRVVQYPPAMAGKLEVNEVPAGLEVGSPPSRGTSNLSARKPVPSYAAPSSMQDGMSQYPQSEDGYRYAPAGEDASRSRRNPCGLSPLIFGLLVALITLIVVGAALGGGLGGSLAAAQKKKYVLSRNALVRGEIRNSAYLQCSLHAPTVLQPRPLLPQQASHHLPHPHHRQLRPQHPQHPQQRQPSCSVTTKYPVQPPPQIPSRSIALP